MKVVSIHSHKGGAGKTTLALMIARRLAEQGKKVCVIDLDFLGSGIDLAIKTKKPERFLEELVVAPVGSEKSPKLDDLVQKHPISESGAHVSLILNTGHWLPVDGGGKEAKTRQQIISALDIEKQAKLIERRLIRLLAGFAEENYDYILLDCHPTLEEISAAVFQVHLSWQHEGKESLLVFVTTPDRAHAYGLLKEMHRRSRGKTAPIDLDRSIFVMNRVYEKENEPPYSSGLSCIEELKEELRYDPVVGDEAVALFKKFHPPHYVRIWYDRKLACRDFVIRSTGEIPSWPPGILTHNGTPLCEELFGPK